jgi:MerR family transcriptional regulator, copper efflux regulator
MEMLTIGRLAERAGVGVETIRFYEREGLLPIPDRTPAGYRMFAIGEVSRLRFIRRAQELGFSLAEIRQLLSLRVDDVGCGAVRETAERKIETIDAKIRDLRRMKRALSDLCDACTGRGPASACAILDALYDEL